MALPWPALADSALETPEYSGPMARQQRDMDDYRGAKALARGSAAAQQRDLRLRRNDRSYDYETQRRVDNVQNEMDRRRDEVRQYRLND